MDFVGRTAKAARIPFGSALLLSVYILTGGRSIARSLRVSPQSLIVMLIACALFSTILIALFGSWANSRPRAAALGFVVAAMVALVVHVTIMPERDIPPVSLGEVLAFMLTFGLLGAFVGSLYRQQRDGL